MLSLRQARDIEMAALKNSGLRHSDGGKTAGTLRNSGRRAAKVERRYESVTERFHFGKGVWLTSLIHHGKDVAFVDRQLVGFEIPARIGGSSLRPSQ